MPAPPPYPRLYRPPAPAGWYVVYMLRGLAGTHATCAHTTYAEARRLRDWLARRPEVLSARVAGEDELGRPATA